MSGNCVHHATSSPRRGPHHLLLFLFHSTCDTLSTFIRIKTLEDPCGVKSPHWILSKGFQKKDSNSLQCLMGFKPCVGQKSVCLHCQVSFAPKLI